MRLTVLAVLVCLILGCQAAPPIAAPPPPATVAPTETVLAAPATAEVWGEVPKQCA